VSAYLRTLVIIGVGAAIGVLVDPTHRGTTLRVALLAVVTVGAVGLVQAGSRRLPPPDPSPFDPVKPAPSRPIVPADLARVAADLDLYRSPTGSRLGSGAADRLVRDVVRHRLATGHGVAAPEDVEHDPAATALLGPATLDALARRRAARPEPVDPGRLATELEQL
jgi:hypothetical protein